MPSCYEGGEMSDALGANSTNELPFPTPFLSKVPGRCGGQWCVGDSRVTRGNLRGAVRVFGIERVCREVYPWMTRQAIVYALRRFRGTGATGRGVRGR